MVRLFFSLLPRFCGVARCRGLKYEDNQSLRLHGNNEVMNILIKWLVCNIYVYWRAEEELSYVHSVHRFLDAMRCTIALVTDVHLFHSQFTALTLKPH